VARLYADLLLEPSSNPSTLPQGLSELYDAALLQAGAAELGIWRGRLRPVLSVLAAGAAGPVMPLALVCAASRQLDWPDRPARVRDVLVDLRGYVARSARAQMKNM
jgi:hypothetical protein